MTLTDSEVTDLFGGKEGVVADTPSSSNSSRKAVDPDSAFGIEMTRLQYAAAQAGGARRTRRRSTRVNRRQRRQRRQSQRQRRLRH
jgi:hypothetical protein